MVYREYGESQKSTEDRYQSSMRGKKKYGNSGKRTAVKRTETAVKKQPENTGKERKRE